MSWRCRGAVTSRAGHAKMPTGPKGRLRPIYDPGRVELRIIADVLALKRAHRKDRCDKRTERTLQMFIDENNLRSATMPRHVAIALRGSLACVTSYPRSYPLV
jgi:hypothetical protein